MSEWEPLTLPFYALVLNYVPYFVFKPVSVLNLLSLLYNVPYYAIKPASMLSSFSLVMYALDDPYVPVPYCMLVTFNAPGSPCLKDPYLKSLSFRGNRAKFKSLSFRGNRASLTSLKPRSWGWASLIGTIPSSTVVGTAIGLRT